MWKRGRYLQHPACGMVFYVQIVSVDLKQSFVLLLWHVVRILHIAIIAWTISAVWHKYWITSCEEDFKVNESEWYTNYDYINFQTLDRHMYTQTVIMILNKQTKQDNPALPLLVMTAGRHHLY